MKRVAKPIFAAWCAAGLSLYAAAACAADNSPAINALLQQAAYWHDKSHDDLARESLQKVLAVVPMPFTCWRSMRCKTAIRRRRRDGAPA
ncbi:hypothetical protein [Sodalis praecaptivus]|uniref:hypothetical protein n=1 Tax=Sodalis praecaptivus TaxID=1239307 RepID=UPI0027E95543|nr:hypothetical protein [Sodalis praecaptivus]CAJ0999905.1 hypothetical protein NVIRENTERO_04057 [Sodalis praecaptivus]